MPVGYFGGWEYDESFKLMLLRPVGSNRRWKADAKDAVNARRAKRYLTCAVHASVQRERGVAMCFSFARGLVL
jgi:hypothetical protein